MALCSWVSVAVFVARAELGGQLHPGLNSICFPPFMPELSRKVFQNVEPLRHLRPRPERLPVQPTPRCERDERRGRAAAEAVS